MARRFLWLMLLVVSGLLPGIFSPAPIFAANEGVLPLVDAREVSSSGVDEVHAEVQPPASAERPPALPDGAGFLQNPAVSVPDQQSLAELVGRTEISVLENIDWQFVKAMDETQVLDEVFAGPADAADLARSIRAGRDFSRESLAASARVEQARARTGQALGLLLPSVTVRANYGTETSAPSVELDDNGNPIPKDTHDRTDVAWTLRQPLFDLPAFLDWRRRQVIEQASRENYRVSDGDAYIATTNAYLTLVSTRIHMDLTRDFEAQLAELLSYIEKRAKGGAASFSDMARVKARSQETLSFRLEQEAAHEAAGIDFVRLTNLVPSKVRLPEFADIGAETLPKTFNAAVAVALNANPEVAGIATEVKAASIDMSAAKSQFLPRLDAEYTDTYSQHAGGDASADGQRDKRGMLVLSWTPLNGGRDYEYLLERSSRHKELQYRLDDERRRVVQALSSNYSTLAITGERINSGYKELKSISLAVEAMSRRMLSGNQSLLDLLDVYDRFYQARSRLVDLHISELYTLAQLVRLTTGTPWAASAQNVSQAGDEGLSLPAKVDDSAKTVAKAPPAMGQIPATFAPQVASAVVAPVAPKPETQSGGKPEAEPATAAEAHPVIAVVAVPEPVLPEGTTVAGGEAEAPTTSMPMTSPADAGAGVGAVRVEDDAYAPLWLDIVPQSGTAFAAKTSEEAATSLVAPVAGAMAVTTAPALPQAISPGPVVSAPGLLSLGLLDTGDALRVDRYVAEVEEKLGETVRVKLFASSDELVNWFARLGIIDLAVITLGERGDLLSGNYAMLQAMPQAESSAPTEVLVARRDLSPVQLKRLAQLFGPAR